MAKTEPTADHGDTMTSPLASLTPDPLNARRHDERNLALIEAALREVGAARSIVVDESGVILAGNATVHAAEQAGLDRVRIIDADGSELVAVRRSGLTAEQKHRLAQVASALPVSPAEVWCVAGSGTLTRALQLAWPAASHHAIQVGRPPEIGQATLHVAPEAFERDARVRPPFPSTSNFDAKAWQFISRQAASDALFWNVAS